MQTFDNFFFVDVDQEFPRVGAEAFFESPPLFVVVRCVVVSSGVYDLAQLGQNGLTAHTNSSFRFVY